MSEGPEALVDDAAPTGAGEAWAARVGTWLQAHARLVEGGSVDRALVEALVEAAATHLVYAGRDAGRVDAARHRFEDRSLGSLELLCASPVSRRILLSGILTAPILLVALDWLILTALLSVAGVISQLTLHINLSGKLGSAAWLLVAPLPLGVLGGALVLILAVIKPGLTDQTAGPGSNVLRLASAAPALVAIVLIIVFGREWGESAIVAGATIVAVVGYVAAIGMLWRVFRPEKILTP